MSGAVHTPGPWVADFHNERMIGGRFVTVVTAPGQLVPIAAVTTGVEGYGRDEGRAKARLIAAAPELLEALEALVEQVENDGWSWAAGLSDARAAIAKARGEP